MVKSDNKVVKRNEFKQKKLSTKDESFLEKHEITPKNKPIINAIQMEATASMIVFGSVSLSI